MSGLQFEFSSTDEVAEVINGLRVASERFAEDVKVIEASNLSESARKRLAAQFTKQRVACERCASRLERFCQ